MTTVERNSLNLEHENSRKKEMLSTYFLAMYIISLYIFVDNVYLINISRFIFILFVSSAVVQILKRKSFFLDKISLLLFTFFAFSLFSILWALDPYLSFRRTILLGQTIILLYFFTTQILSSFRQIDILIKGIGYSGIILFLYSISLYGIDNIYDAIISGDRFGSEISQENILGGLAAISAVIFYVEGITKKKFRYLLYMLMPIIMMLASGSRNGVLIFTVGVLLSSFANVEFKKVYKYIIGLPVVIVILYFLLQLNVFDTMKMRFLDLNSALSDKGGDGTVRLNMVKWGWEWFLEAPFFGSGIGNYGVLLYEKINMQTYAHNNFIELLVGLGIVGFLLYYTVYIYIIYKLIPIIKKGYPHSITIFTLFCSWFISEIASVNYTSKMTYVIIGISVAYIRIANQTKNHIKID